VRDFGILIDTHFKQKTVLARHFTHYQLKVQTCYSLNSIYQSFRQEDYRGILQGNATTTRKMLRSSDITYKIEHIQRSSKVLTLPPPGSFRYLQYSWSFSFHNMISALLKSLSFTVPFSVKRNCDR
jgi:hypothetical protein